MQKTKPKQGYIEFRCSQSLFLFLISYFNAANPMFFNYFLISFLASKLISYKQGFYGIVELMVQIKGMKFKVILREDPEGGYSAQSIGYPEQSVKVKTAK